MKHSRPLALRVNKLLKSKLEEQKSKPDICRIEYAPVSCGIAHNNPREHYECIMNDQPHIRETLEQFHALGVYVSAWFPKVDEDDGA